MTPNVLFPVLLPSTKIESCLIVGCTNTVWCGVDSNIRCDLKCSLFQINNLDSGSTRVAILLRRLPFIPRMVGLFCMEFTNGKSISVRNIDLGDKFDAARPLGIVTLCMGSFILLFHIAAVILNFPPCLFRTVGGFCILTAVLQATVFMLRDSVLCNNGCKLDTAGKCAAAAMVFWILAGLVSCAIRKDEEIHTSKKSKPKATKSQPKPDPVEPDDELETPVNGNNEA
jgi:hypothetical protein